MSFQDRPKQQLFDVVITKYFVRIIYVRRSPRYSQYIQEPRAFVESETADMTSKGEVL